LYDREFDLLIRQRNWGEDRVYFTDDTGKLVSVPANYTNVDASGPFVVISAGRSRFRYEDLLNLVRLIHHLDEAGTD
jgi:hypothetical protein